MSSFRIESEDYVSYFDKTTGNRGSAKQFTDDVDVYNSSDAGDGRQGFTVGATSQGEYLDYTITVAEAGIYQLSARIASANGKDKKFQVLIDGQAASFDFDRNTGGWFSWADVSASEGIALEAGTHDVRVRMQTGGFMLNYIDLERTGSIGTGSTGTGSTGTGSTGTGSTNTGNDSNGSDSGTSGTDTSGSSTSTVGNSGNSVRIESEDYVSYFDKTTGNRGSAKQFTDDVDVYNSSDAGDGRQGFTVGATSQGEYLDYTITVAEAGIYQLSARIASANGKDKKFQVLIDGQAASFDFDRNTGGWFSWADVSASEGIALEAGTHDVRVRMQTGGFMLNYIDLERTGSIGTGSTGTGSTGTGNDGNNAQTPENAVFQKIGNPIEAGTGSQVVRGGSSTLTASYAQADTGITADLDSSRVTYGVNTVKIGSANSSPLRIMPLGDSITKGGDSFDKGGYRDNLWKSLTNGGFNVNFVGPESLGDSSFDSDHAGVGGNAIDDIRERVNEQRIISEYRPDAVLLMVGTNDALRNIDLDDAPARLERLIGDITRQRPGTHIFVASIPPMSRDHKNRQIKKDYSPRLINNVVSKFDNATFVDVFNNLGKSDLQEDGVHLTKGGSTKVANIWFDAIQQKYSESEIRTTEEVDTLDRIINVIGSSYDDVLIGNSASNTLIGRGGDDSLTGGAQADNFVLSRNGGFDTFTDFEVGKDVIVLSDGLNFDQVSLESGSRYGYGSRDTVLLHDDDQLALLRNVQASELDVDSFATTSMSFV